MADEMNGLFRKIFPTEQIHKNFMNKIICYFTGLKCWGEIRKISPIKNYNSLAIVCRTAQPRPRCLNISKRYYFCEFIIF
ncbi:hypothetical protein PDESU_03192 [Pontiella desulfatans]|uniref:Uncharacterized protein n=1 Tax=Pontiella desulfatans TaxID=2750659 RepID=A0A6C2U479_PONDE|nr:hypothetical protein PDESU_03192 [Pontiella desulfatans]